MNRNVNFIGLDIAKTVFYVVGKDNSGREIVKCKLKRTQVLDFFANIPCASVGIEACSGVQCCSRCPG